MLQNPVKTTFDWVLGSCKLQCCSTHVDKRKKYIMQ